MPESLTSEDANPESPTPGGERAAAPKAGDTARPRSASAPAAAAPEPFTVAAAATADKKPADKQPAAEKPAAAAEPVAEKEPAVADELDEDDDELDEDEDDEDDEDEDEGAEAPEAEDPAFPKPASNRVFGTFVVLAATGVFQGLWLLAFVVYVLLSGGGSTLGASIANFVTLTVWWVPTVVLFVFFEALVLLANRARSFTYVVASVVIGLLVYALNTIFYVLSAAASGATVTSSAVISVFESVLFIVVGLLAREVVLWAGLIIGARGARLKRRHREAVEEYDAALAALDAA